MKSIPGINCNSERALSSLCQPLVFCWMGDTGLYSLDTERLLPLLPPDFFLARILRLWPHQRAKVARGEKEN